jgi:hypothetical protein
MRADAHYVEQLDASTPAVAIQYIEVHAIDVSDMPEVAAPPALAESIKRHGVLEPLIVQRNNGTYTTIAGQKRLAGARVAGLRQVPCLVHHVGDDRARVLREALSTQSPPSREEPPVRQDLGAMSDAQVADALSALASCSQLLSPSTPSLTRAVAVDLMQAEIWRASCVFQSARVVRRGVTPTLGTVFPRELVQRVVESTDGERRLRRLSIDMEVSTPDTRPLHGDLALLHSGLSSVVLAVIALLDGVSGARVLLTGDAADGRVTVGVSQDYVAIADPGAERSGGGAPVEPRLAPVTLAILALGRIAESHGGRASVQRAGSGARISIELPLDTSRG